MKRAPIAAGLAVAALAATATTATATVRAECDTNATAGGIIATLDGYRTDRTSTVQLTVTDTATSRVLYQQPVQVRGSRVLSIPTAGAPFVAVTAAWGGPTRPQDTNTVQVPGVCKPPTTPPTAPEPPATPPPAPEPPASTPPATPPATPPSTPPSTPPKRTCAQLRAAGAGPKWTSKCPPVVKRCPKGTARRVIRPAQGKPRQVCVRPIPPRRTADNPTG